MLNHIWLAILLTAFLVGGFTGRLPQMTEGAFAAAKTAVMDIALPMVGIMAIWMGVMRLAELSGLVAVLARALRPIMRRLFPDVPVEHPAMGAMVMNMAANMLGLSNAATPLGLRAMALLDSLNPRKGVASNAMVTFLTINTASIQLIPTTAIGILSVAKARDATAFVPAAVMATTIAFAAGVTMSKILQRTAWFRLPDLSPTPDHKDMDGNDSDAPPSATPEITAATIAHPPLSVFRKSILLFFLAACIGMFITLLQHPSEEMASRPMVIRVLTAISTLTVPTLLCFFPLYASLRGVKVYSEFAEGAKQAFETGVRIIPYLVAMLVAVRMLREAKVIDWMTGHLQFLLDACGFDPRLLPMVLIRPLSGSATQGLFVELVNQPALLVEGGADSLLARTAATIYGSTETTFYVLALYFGSVKIREARHAVLSGLTADTVAVVASVVICRILFA